MADVQLEHGYLRIANALEEATFYADFSGAQLKILRCLIRLTYGWQQRTVQIARPDIAKRCRLSATGGFNRALDELLKNHVVLELSPGTGRAAAVYAINKDFEHWGEFSVSNEALETLFSERPESGRPTLQGGSTEEVWDGSHTLQGGRGQPCGVVEGHPVGYEKSPEVVDSGPVRPPERQERQEIQTITTAARELSIAANQGLAEHAVAPQLIPRIIATSGSSHTAADAITQAGVPIAFAKSQVYELARTHRAERPIGSLRYFVDAVVERWHEHTAARDAVHAERPAPVALRRGEVSGADPDVWKRAAAEIDAREREAARATPPPIAACAVARKR